MADFSNVLQNIPRSAKNVTKSDSDVLDCMCIYVGTTGDVTVIMDTGNSVLYSSVPAGMYLIGAFKKLMSTGTSASNFVAHWLD